MWNLYVYRTLGNKKITIIKVQIGNRIIIFDGTVAFSFKNYFCFSFASFVGGPKIYILLQDNEFTNNITVFRKKPLTIHGQNLRRNKNSEITRLCLHGLQNWDGYRKTGQLWPCFSNTVQGYFGVTSATLLISPWFIAVWEVVEI